MKLPNLSCHGRRHVPLPRGPYTVGCADVVTSFSKSGAFIRLFYPAETSAAQEHHLEWPLWMPHKQYLIGSAIRAGIYPSIYKKLFPLLVGDVYIPAVWHGRFLRQNSPYPVIVFSHGLGGFRNAYSSLCLEMASHGFVVAAVEHRDNSACATFYLKQERMSACGPYPGAFLEDLDRLLDKNAKSEWTDAVDGKWEPKSLPQFIGPSPYLKEWILYKNIDEENEVQIRRKQLDERAGECSYALDILESLNSGTFTMNLLDPNFRAEYFRGCLDVRRPTIVGHSFGGATVILSLAIELRFKAGVALDPWMLPFEHDTSLFSLITQPLLSVCSDYFQDAKSMVNLMKLVCSTTNECIVQKISKAKHRDQCDLPFLGSIFSMLVGASGKRTGFRTHYLSSELTMEFLSRHLGLNLSNQTVDSSVRKKYVMDCF